MKKLILIFAFAIFGVVGFGQNNVTGTYFVLDTLLADSALAQLNLSENYAWQLGLKWTKNTDSLGFIIQHSIDNSDWNNYAGIDTVWTTQLTGTIAFEDWFCTGRYIRSKILVTDTAIVQGKYYFKRVSK